MNDDNKKGACAPFLLQPRQESAWAWTKRNGRFAQAPLANMPRHVATLRIQSALQASLTRSTSATASLLEAKGDLQPRQDSNLDQAFRKRLFYPLNYGAVVAKIERPTFCGGKDATHL